jgi:hypothetical protein
MIELDLVEGHPVEIPLDLRTVRGRPAPDAPARLVGRVVVGTPRARLLTAADAGADQELQQFIKAEASTSSYYLVVLSCTFVSDDEQRLADAWLRLDLDGAVAQSMEPVTLEEITELSYNVKIGVPCVINSEFTLGGKKNKRETAVQALYEGTSTPAWTFAETASRPLHGLQRLRMIVRAPAGQPVRGTISIGANVRAKRLGVLPYVAPIAELPALPRLEVT